MMQKDMMDRLLMSSQVFIEMTDNCDGRMTFHFSLRIRRYQYGLRGLPAVNIGMYLFKSEDGILHWQIPAGTESYDHKAWDKIFATHSTDDIAYYLNKIYTRLMRIAEARHLLDGNGIVYQLPDGIR